MSTNSLIAQKTITNGIISSKSDSSKIIHAHIINTTSKIGVTSNQNGEFSIKTESEDTLLISFIGYRSLAIKASELITYIYLEKTTYNIDSYTVLPYKNFQEFKEAFVNLEIKDTFKHEMNPSIMALVKPFDPNNLNSQLSFSGPISGLAAKFNKRIKDRQNYKRLLAKDRYKAFLATKFNSNVIQQTTLLRDESQINSFMEYCDFTDQFIELSSQYNLFDQIIKCFNEYNNLSITNN